MGGDLEWKIYRVGQLSRMIREQPDDRKAQRYARTLRQTVEEIITLSMHERRAVAREGGEGEVE